MDKLKDLYEKKIVRNTRLSSMGGGSGSTSKYVDALDELEENISKAGGGQSAAKQAGLAGLEARQEMEEKQTPNERTKDEITRLIESTDTDAMTDTQSRYYLNVTSGDTEAAKRFHEELMYDYDTEARSPGGSGESFSFADMVAEKNPLNMCNYWPGPDYTCPFPSGIIIEATAEAIEMAMEELPFCEMLEAYQTARKVAGAVQSMANSAQSIGSGMSNMDFDGIRKNSGSWKDAKKQACRGRHGR